MSPSIETHELLAILATGDHRQQLSAVLGCLLEDAAEVREWDLAQTLMRAGADARPISIEEAVRGKQVQLVEYLLGKATPSTIDLVDLDDHLLTAAFNSDPGMVAVLLQNGAEIDALDIDDWTPLHHAADEGSAAAVQALIEAGANSTLRGADIRGEGGMPPVSALEVAVRGRHDAVVGVMAKHGVDLNAQNEDGWTPLHHAADEGSVSAAQLLLEAGADSTLRGADTPFGESEAQLSALDLAIRGKQDEVVRLMIKLGVDVNGRSGSTWNTALHQARGGAVVDVLIEAGGYIEASNAGGRTPLLEHCGGDGCLEAAGALVQHGADISAKDEDGLTPLDHAVFIADNQGAPELIDLLLRSGADETTVPESFLARHATLVGDRVRKLLRNAPADRAWRRRGLLLLCIAHRPQEPLPSTVRRRLEDNDGDSWTRAAAWLPPLRAGNEGIFRTIVLFL